MYRCHDYRKGLHGPVTMWCGGTEFAWLTGAIYSDFGENLLPLLFRLYASFTAVSGGIPSGSITFGGYCAHMRIPNKFKGSTSVHSCGWDRVSTLIFQECSIVNIYTDFACHSEWSACSWVRKLFKVVPLSVAGKLLQFYHLLLVWSAQWSRSGRIVSWDWLSLLSWQKQSGWLKPASGVTVMLTFGHNSVGFDLVLHSLGMSVDVHFGWVIHVYALW